MTLFGVPGWAVALVVAGLTPFAASAWGKLVERRVRERTRGTLRALSSSPMQRTPSTSTPSSTEVAS